MSFAACTIVNSDLLRLLLWTSSKFFCKFFVWTRWIGWGAAGVAGNVLCEDEDEEEEGDEDGSYIRIIAKVQGTNSWMPSLWLCHFAGFLSACRRTVYARLLQCALIEFVWDGGPDDGGCTTQVNSCRATRC